MRVKARFYNLTRTVTGVSPTIWNYGKLPVLSQARETSRPEEGRRPAEEMRGASGPATEGADIGSGPLERAGGE